MAAVRLKAPAANPAPSGTLPGGGGEISPPDALTAGFSRVLDMLLSLVRILTYGRGIIPTMVTILRRILKALSWILTQAFSASCSSLAKEVRADSFFCLIMGLSVIF